MTPRIQQLLDSIRIEARQIKDVCNVNTLDGKQAHEHAVNIGACVILLEEELSQ